MDLRRAQLFAWAALLVLGGCGVVNRFARGPQHPGSIDAQDHDSIVLSRETVVTIDGEPGYERVDRQTLLILRPAGRRHARVVIPLDHRAELLDVRARS